MLTKAWFLRVGACLAIGGSLTTVAWGQYISPQIGSYYNYPYGYGPNPYYDTVPRPPIGSYLPQQPQVPPFPFLTVPPTQIIPQPYAYGYQPPPYPPYSYVRPYNLPGQIRRYYDGRSYTYPGPGYWWNRPYYRRARPQPRLNVAPVGGEDSPQDNPGPRQDSPTSPPTSQEPNQP
jgi:hypothetical protein